MNKVTVNDIDIAFRDEGRGASVLLVHGFPLDNSMWDPVVELLGGDCRLIRPDLRGYGQTTLGEIDDAAGVSMRRYADDLAGLLDAIGVDGPLTFCGFSMGGYIGWQFLEAYGGRVAKLAMCDTRAAADTDEARSNRLRMADHVTEWGAERVAEAMLPKLFAPSSIAKELPVVSQTAKLIAACDPRAIAAAQRGMAARPDVTDRLPTYAVPAVAIVGEEDQLSTPAEMRSMAEEMPDAEAHVIPNSGHMAPVENPPAVAEALRKLL